MWAWHAMPLRLVNDLPGGDGRPQAQFLIQDDHIGVVAFDDGAFRQTEQAGRVRRADAAGVIVAIPILKKTRLIPKDNQDNDTNSQKLAYEISVRLPLWVLVPAIPTCSRSVVTKH